MKKRDTTQSSFPPPDFISAEDAAAIFSFFDSSNSSSENSSSLSELADRSLLFWSPSDTLEISSDPSIFSLSVSFSSSISSMSPFVLLMKTLSSRRLMVELNETLLSLDSLELLEVFLSSDMAELTEGLCETLSNSSSSEKTSVVAAGPASWLEDLEPEWMVWAP